jgi:transposase
MSRPRKFLDVHNEAQLVLARYARQRAGWQRERLHAIKLGLEGKLSLVAIAHAVGRARSVVQEWFDLYRTGGLDLLLRVRRGKGPKSLLTNEYEQLLRKGLEKGEWHTAAQARQMLAEHGLNVKPTALYHYLGKIRAAAPGKSRERGARRLAGARAASLRKPRRPDATGQASLSGTP